MNHLRSGMCTDWHGLQGRAKSVDRVPLKCECILHNDRKADARFPYQKRAKLFGMGLKMGGQSCASYDFKYG